MRKISAAIAAVMLTSGLALVASSPAVAAEAEADACYVNETHTELVWELQRSDWIAATHGSPATYGTVGNYDDTRATGHYEATADGLHIWTEGAASTDKVAGYIAVDIPLAGATASFVDYTATTGIPPGAQLVVKYGDEYGILVREPVYGGPWWLNNAAGQTLKDASPNVGGGYGSENYGTLAEWGDALPSATIVAVGFSLGSGVLGDGIVHGVTVNGTVYEFIEETTPAVDPVPEHYTDWYVVSEDQGAELPDGREDGEEFQTDALYRYIVTGDIDVIEKVIVDCPPVTEEPKPTPEPTKTPVPVVPASNTGQLADTGFDATPMLVMAIIGLIVGAGVLVSTRIVTKRSSR